MKYKIFLLIAVVILVVAAVGYFIFINQPSKSVVSQSPDNVTTYTSEKFAFSMYYPLDFTVNENYSYTAMGPGKDIPGVSFTIPASSTIGTNLSNDSYISVEVLPKTKCSVTDFLDSAESQTTVTDPLAGRGDFFSGGKLSGPSALYTSSKGSASVSSVTVTAGASGAATSTTGGVTYQVGTSVGAAAGNRYEETVYLLPHCQAIRYYIHSSNIYNYDPGTVKEFDRDKLIQLFDQIRRSYQYQK